MKKHQLLLLALLVCCCAEGQDLQNIKAQKPVSWSGSIGAAASFYSSNETFNTQPPYAWNIYGSFTGNIYGVALPFNFLVNQYGKSYSNPFTQFGVSPTYKWIRLHLGYRNMLFSPLTFEGQSFRGGGIELTPGILRFAAFTGKLNRAVNEDTSSGRYAVPQFSRKAYGVKLGIGTAERYLDFIFFKARDDSNSAKLQGKAGLRPQDNAVAGSSFRIRFLKYLVWSADAAVSGWTQDMAIEKDSSDRQYFDKLLHSNASTTVAWAGQTLLSLNIKSFGTSIGYRRVQPDFKSLGTPYMLNDIQLVSMTNNLGLAKGKFNLVTAFSKQHNNLNKKLASELHTSTGNINVNAFLSNHLSLNVNANGYKLEQREGFIKLRDSFRLDQQLYQLSLTPVYTITSAAAMNTVTANIMVGALDDNNPATDDFTANKTRAASLTFSRFINASSISLSLTGMYNRYLQGENEFTSRGITAGGGISLLKQKNLNLQGTVGYLFNNYQTAKAGGNFTFSANAGYNKARHSFALYSNYLITMPGAVMPTPDKAPYSVMTRNWAGGISYGYSFK